MITNKDTRIAHLILIHKNPQQVERLLKAIQHPLCDCYLHIDKKMNIKDFEYLSQYPGIFFIQKREDIQWAGYGTIQATLNGFEEILPLAKYHYINVISGQDFPLYSATYIHKYIQERQGQEFITCEKVEGEWKEAKPRIAQYHFINWKIPGKHKLEMIFNKLMPPRKFPLDFEMVGRANWFTLTAPAAKYVLDFLDKNPKVVRYFKYCWGADEFIFASILWNSSFKEKIVDNLVFADWTGQTKGHPRIFDENDFEKLMQCKKLYARKFDSSHNEKIIALLEEKIAQSIN